MKDKKYKKKTLQPLTLAFLEQLQIHLRDLLQYFLHLSEGAQAFFYLFLQLAGDRDLTHLTIAETDGKNPNRPVAFTLALLAKPAARCVAVHHPAQQRAGQDAGEIRHLPQKLLAEGRKLDSLIFHLYTMKDIILVSTLQVENNRTPQNYSHDTAHSRRKQPPAPDKMRQCKLNCYRACCDR